MGRRNLFIGPRKTKARLTIWLTVEGPTRAPLLAFLIKGKLVDDLVNHSRANAKLSR